MQGPYRLDLKLGPSVGIIDTSGTRFRLGVHFGMGVISGPRYRLLLALPVGFGLGAGFTFVSVLPGIEADVQIVSGMPFFLYPMIGVGMGVLVSPCTGPPQRARCENNLAFGLRAGVGIRYVVWGRWNFLFEPFNLEFYPAGSAGYTMGFYNVLLGAGVNF